MSIKKVYYKSRKEEKDLKLKEQIERVLTVHHAYGHRRIAMELEINKKRVYRD